MFEVKCPWNGWIKKDEVNVDLSNEIALTLETPLILASALLQVVLYFQ